MKIVCEGVKNWPDMEFKIINGKIYLVNGEELQALNNYDIKLKQIKEIK